MKKFSRRLTILALLFLVFYIVKFSYLDVAKDWKLPFNTLNRKDFSTIQFERDAGFKAIRPSYDGFPPHYHAGVDMQIRQSSTIAADVYAIASGIVVQIADSPPLRRIVIQHKLPFGRSIWSVYLHVVEEKVKIGDRVTSQTVIARTLNRSELNYFGWKYNHLHLEIMKKPPLAVQNPYQRRSFNCLSPEQVDKYFWDPVKFLQSRFRRQQ